LEGNGGPDDYPSAISYLTLIVSPAAAKRTVESLREAELTRRKAKDLLRASGLALLPGDNSEVRERLRAMIEGDELTPVPLVRNSSPAGHLIVADGYHRICASYILDEDADIPCRIVDLTTA
jgi:hypothetical protein